MHLNVFFACMATYPGPLFHSPQGPPPPPVDREAPDPLHPCMGGCPHEHSCQSESMHAHKPTVQPPLKWTTIKNGLFCAITYKETVPATGHLLKTSGRTSRQLTY